MDDKIKAIIISELKKHEKLSLILHHLFIEICDISQKKYFILGSYAIRELRPINDLDINLDYSEFFKLSKLTDLKMGSLEFYNNQIRWFYNLTDTYNILTGEHEKDFSIEAFQKLPLDGFPNKTFSLKELIENNKLDIDSNGHQFYNIKTLLDWKKTLNREKDKADIELINSVIKGGSKKSTKKIVKKTVKKRINK
jgi:hypothetical protein